MTDLQGRLNEELIAAVEDGDSDKVRALVEEGAEVNCRVTWLCDTPLHNTVEGNQSEMVKLWVGLGANVNAHSQSRNTPLHQAVEGKQLEMVKLLVELGADINAQNDTKDSPLHQATKGNQPEMVKLLVELGANVNAQNDTKDSPLHQTTKENQPEMVNLLVELGADVNAQNDTKDSPLHQATKGKQPEMVNLLVELGANVNAQNDTKDTPLMSAVSKNSVAIVKFLLQHGANKQVKNISGKTVLDMISSQECGKLFQMLYFGEGSNDKMLVEGLDNLSGDIRYKHFYLDSNSITSLPDLSRYKQLENLDNLHISSDRSKIKELKGLPGGLKMISLFGAPIAILSRECFPNKKLYNLLRASMYESQISNLKQPPMEIFNQGWTTVNQYFKSDLAMTATTSLVLMGETNAGKSSLIRALIAERPNPTDKADRTQVVDLKLWQVDNSNGFLVFDLGGHPIYAVTSPLFVSPKSSIILAHDISIKAKEADDKTLKVFKRAIQQHPDTDIVVVFTHADLLEADELSIRCTMFSNSLEHWLQMKIETLGKLKSQSMLFPINEINSLIEKLQKKMKSIPSFAVSNTSYQGIKGLKKHLEGKLLQQQTAIPKSWVKCFRNVCQRNEKFLHKTGFDYCFLKDKPWLMHSLAKFAKKNEIQNCLTYLGATGLILHYQDIKILKDTIFHKPEVLVNLFKVVLHHDFVKALNYENDNHLQQSFKLEEFKEVRDRYQNEGLLNHKLLSHLWSKYDLDEKDKKVLIEVLKKFNICHEVGLTSESVDYQMYFIPWYIMENNCPDLWEEIDPKYILLNFECLFHNEVPENVCEMLCVSLQRHAMENGYLGKRYAWSNGLLVTLGGIECITYRNIDEASIQVKMKGEVDYLDAMWFSCQELHSVLTAILEQFHGVLRAFYMKCFHCKLQGIEPPHCWPLFQVFATDINPNVTHAVLRCPNDSTHNIPSPLIRYFNQDFTNKYAYKVVAYLDKVHIEKQPKEVVFGLPGNTDPINIGEESKEQIEDEAHEKGLHCTERDLNVSEEQAKYIINRISPSICRIFSSLDGGTGFIVGSITNTSTQQLHRFLLTCYHLKLADAFRNNIPCRAEFGVTSSAAAACIVPIFPQVWFSNSDLDYCLVCLEPSQELERYLAFHDTLDLGHLITDLKPQKDDPLIVIGHHPREKKLDFGTYTAHMNDFIPHPDVQRARYLKSGININRLDDSRFMLYQCHSFQGASGGPCFSAQRQIPYGMHCGGIFTKPDCSNPKDSIVEYGVLLWEVIKDIESQVQNKQMAASGDPVVFGADDEGLYKLFPNLKPKDLMGFNFGKMGL